MTLISEKHIIHVNYLCMWKNSIYNKNTFKRIFRMTKRVYVCTETSILSDSRSHVFSFRDFSTSKADIRCQWAIAIWHMAMLLNLISSYETARDGIRTHIHTYTFLSSKRHARKPGKIAGSYKYIGGVRSRRCEKLLFLASSFPFYREKNKRPLALHQLRMH